MPLKMIRSYLNRFIRKPAKTTPHIQPDGEYPVAVQLESTGVCNFRCTMCSTTYFPFNKTLEDAVFDKVLEATPHITALVPNVGGEPLLYGKFLPMLEKLKAVNPDLFIAFNTNASLFTEDICRAFVHLGVNEIIVSADGATAETYNAIRVGGDFDTMVRNAGMMFRVKGPAPLPLLAMLMVISRQNAHEMPQFVTLAAKLGVRKILINGVEPYTSEHAANACYSEQPDPAIAALIDEAHREAQRNGMEFLAPSLEVTREKRYCPALSVCIVRADGEVYPCSPYSTGYQFYYHGELTRHLGPRSFGNLKERTLHDIWNSATYREFRNAIREHKLHPECRHCLLAEGIICNVQIYPI